MSAIDLDIDDDDEDDDATDIDASYSSSLCRLGPGLFVSGLCCEGNSNNTNSRNSSNRSRLINEPLQILLYPDRSIRIESVSIQWFSGKLLVESENTSFLGKIFKLQEPLCKLSNTGGGVQINNNVAAANNYDTAAANAEKISCVGMSNGRLGGHTLLSNYIRPPQPIVDNFNYGDDDNNCNSNSDSNNDNSSNNNNNNHNHISNGKNGDDSDLPVLVQCSRTLYCMRSYFLFSTDDVTLKKTKLPISDLPRSVSGLVDQARVAYECTLSEDDLANPSVICVQCDSQLLEKDLRDDETFNINIDSIVAIEMSCTTKVCSSLFQNSPMGNNNNNNVNNMNNNNRNNQRALSAGHLCSLGIGSSLLLEVKGPGKVFFSRSINGIGNAAPSTSALSPKSNLRSAVIQLVVSFVLFYFITQGLEQVLAKLENLDNAIQGN